MSKKYIIIFFIVVIIFLGFWFFKDYFFRAQEEKKEFNKPQQYTAEDKSIIDFLDLISAKDKGVYGEVKEAIFEWNSKEKISKTSGFELSAKEAHTDDYIQVTKHFEESGFSFDNFNVADGAGSGLVGYKKDNFICLVRHELTDSTKIPNEPIQFNSDKQEINISCGFLSKEIL